jgi:hypothetical protein
MNEVDVSEAYQVKSSRRFEVLEKYRDNEDIKKFGKFLEETFQIMR